MERHREKCSASELISEAEKRAQMVSKLANEMLDICRGLSMDVVKAALQEAVYTCDKRAFLAGRYMPND